MHFTILTPCFNAAHTLPETMQSVLNQTALQTNRATLTYVIVDGASTDGTAEAAQATTPPKNSELIIISEPDSGMYDALAKGLAHIPEKTDVVAYLNAGDLYNPHAFDVIIDLLTTYPDVAWLTGLDVILNEAGQTVAASLPFRYQRGWFSVGGYLNNPLPFVQQESTFWRAALNQHINTDKLRSLRLAGDYYLWHTFAAVTQLVVISAHLGAFRVHRGQQSAALDAYIDEVRQFTQRPNIIQQTGMWLDKLLWYAPVPIRRKLTPQLYIYHHKLGKWLSSSFDAHVIK